MVAGKAGDQETNMTTKTPSVVQTLTFEDNWERHVETRAQAALAVKERLEARLVTIIEARANAMLDILAP